MTEKEKFHKLQTACRVVVARFRVCIEKDKAMDAFIKKGSMKEILTALKNCSA